MLNWHKRRKGDRRIDIKFGSDTSFRKKLFIPDSFAHPAKMDAQLLIWLVERYTQPGDLILDPMAGSGTTMLACIIGRNVILVELEKHFCDIMVRNWEKVSTIPTLFHAMGHCTIVQGDARRLEGIMDTILTSPPYAEARDRSKEASFDRERSGKYPGRGDLNISKGYTPVDGIITSPPYEESMGERHESPSTRRIREGKRAWNAYTNRGGDTDNIGNKRNQSYLEAMREVYGECFRALKTGGIMVLVVKNFIRDKKIVRLDEDTRTLCHTVGFQFVEKHRRKLVSQSFWRTIYRQKYPDAPSIDFEDILVFRKGASM